MRWSRLVAVVAAALGGLGHIVVAQQAAVAIRPLGPIVATAAESLGAMSSIRVLSTGSVLVNDPRTRRLMLFDSSLQHATIVADTTSGTGKAYGSGLNSLVAFAGDSSLVTDQLTDAFLVIDPMGHVARIIRAPTRANLATFKLPNTTLGYDQAGHLMFRAPPPFFMSLLDPDFVGDTLMVGPDSTAILRQDLATARVDTVAELYGPRVRQAVTRRGRGLGGSGHSAFNPIPSGDDWTLLNDGTLALVRVNEYRVDRVGPDGRVAIGPPIPTHRERLTDSMKVAVIASLRAGDSTYAAGRGGDPSSGPLRAFVEPSDLPDYRPPFVSGFTRADAAGNVWIRVNSITSGAPAVVYDVVSPARGLIDRVQIPLGFAVAGFGPGVVYLETGTYGPVQLVKARIH